MGTAKKIKNLTVPKEDVPVLSEVPSPQELKYFQDFIDQLAQLVGINVQSREFGQEDDHDLFWEEIKNSFHPDLHMSEILDCYTWCPGDPFLHIAPPTVRKGKASS